jgi:phage terminase large subunit-like protein
MYIVAPSLNKVVIGENKPQPVVSGETTGILDSNYILITSLTERIGYHEKAPVTANTSCRSEG